MSRPFKFKRHLKRLLKWGLVRWPSFWGWVQSITFLNKRINALILNGAIEELPDRPEPFANPPQNFTTWEGLTNRRWSSRHLPPAETDFWPKTADDARLVADKLFARIEGKSVRCSRKSTLTFPLFAQWFVDGFLVGDPTNRQRNHSNHQIDLSQLYGRHTEITDLIREKSGGRLKSERIDGAEYPPKLYDAEGKIKPEFCIKREGYLGFDDIGVAPIHVNQNLGPDHQPEVGDHVPQQPIKHGVVLEHEGKTTVVPRHLVYQEIPRRDNLLSMEQDPEKNRDTLATIYAIANDRGNSTLGFTMFSTLMLREHNRIADKLHEENPDWKDEQLFQTTRNILTVLLIRIVVEEYINHITPYHFRLFCDPASFFKPKPWKWQNWMTTEFQLLYRWHSMVPDEMELPDDTSLLMEQTLWNPKLLEEYGLPALLQSTSKQYAGDLGGKNTWKWLISRAEAPSIEMGRNCKLKSYNEYREACNLKKVTSFTEVTQNTDVQKALKEIYEDVDSIEFFTGIFCEDPRKDAALGPTIGVMVAADAFSQALPNPLLQERIWNKETFGQYGWDLLQEKNITLDALLKRNSPELSEEEQEKLHITMTHPNWKHSSFKTTP